MSKNGADAAESKRSILVGVVIAAAVTISLLLLLGKPFGATILGKTDLSSISEDRLNQLEKQAGSEQAAAAAAAVPTGPGHAQPLPESALRVPREKK